MSIRERFFLEYIKKIYDITYDKNDELLIDIKYDMRYLYNYIPPSDIILSENAYNDYLSKFFDKNHPLYNKKGFDAIILKYKENIKIAKEKKEMLKQYFIKKYKLKDDSLFELLLHYIIQKYNHDSLKNYKFRDDIVVYLQDTEVQYIIERRIQQTLKKQEEIEEIKKSATISSIKGPSEKNKNLYKIVEDMIADKEKKLNVKINEANNKLKELSGLDNDEIESVINDVYDNYKRKINNKREELELKEKIIQFLNPAQIGDLINLID